eukprot:GSA120T00026044001.1
MHGRVFENAEQAEPDGASRGGDSFLQKQGSRAKKRNEQSAAHGFLNHISVPFEFGIRFPTAPGADTMLRSFEDRIWDPDHPLNPIKMEALQTSLANAIAGLGGIFDLVDNVAITDTETPIDLALRANLPTWNEIFGASTDTENPDVPGAPNTEDDSADPEQPVVPLVPVSREMRFVVSINKTVADAVKQVQDADFRLDELDMGIDRIESLNQTVLTFAAALETGLQNFVAILLDRDGDGTPLGNVDVKTQELRLFSHSAMAESFLQMQAGTEQQKLRKLTTTKSQRENPPPDLVDVEILLRFKIFLPETNQQLLADQWPATDGLTDVNQEELKASLAGQLSKMADEVGELKSIIATKPKAAEDSPEVVEDSDEIEEKDEKQPNEDEPGNPAHSSSGSLSRELRFEVRVPEAIADAAQKAQSAHFMIDEADHEGLDLDTLNATFASLSTALEEQMQIFLTSLLNNDGSTVELGSVLVEGQKLEMLWDSEASASFLQIAHAQGITKKMMHKSTRASTSAQAKAHDSPGAPDAVALPQPTSPRGCLLAVEKYHCYPSEDPYQGPASVRELLDVEVVVRYDPVTESPTLPFADVYDAAKPLVVHFGTIYCPVTDDNISKMKALADKNPAVQFVTVLPFQNPSGDCFREETISSGYGYSSTGTPERVCRTLPGSTVPGLQT